MTTQDAKVFQVLNDRDEEQTMVVRYVDGVFHFWRGALTATYRINPQDLVDCLRLAAEDESVAEIKAEINQAVIDALHERISRCFESIDTMQDDSERMKDVESAICELDDADMRLVYDITRVQERQDSQSEMLHGMNGEFTTDLREARKRITALEMKNQDMEQQLNLEKESLGVTQVASASNTQTIIRIDQRLDALHDRIRNVEAMAATPSELLEISTSISETLKSVERSLVARDDLQAQRQEALADRITAIESKLGML